jgi:hypothetical protein
MFDEHEAESAVVTVGDGRGFVIKHRHDRLVVTAAHCLPRFPPCHGASYLEERTHSELLAPLGDDLSVWAECLFADPIADIAVLGSPDDQELTEAAEAYEALVESATPLSIADVPAEEFGAFHPHPGFLLSLEGSWFPCIIEYIGDGPLLISDAAQRIVGGMSGSPILSAEGLAIGVVCLGGNHAANARLASHLPGWLLREPALVAEDD